MQLNTHTTVTLRQHVWFLCAKLLNYIFLLFIFLVQQRWDVIFFSLASSQIELYTALLFDCYCYAGVGSAVANDYVDSDGVLGAQTTARKPNAMLLMMVHGAWCRRVENIKTKRICAYGMYLSNIALWHCNQWYDRERLFLANGTSQSPSGNKRVWRFCVLYIYFVCLLSFYLAFVVPHHLARGRYLMMQQ